MKYEEKTYMAHAEAMAKNSYAKRAQVGAVLVTKQGVVVGGYNGTPHGMGNTCEDEWGTLDHVVHAEMNCIAKAAKQGVAIEGAVLYSTLSPCLKCAAVLIQSGVRKVVFDRAYDAHGINLLQCAGVAVTKYQDEVGE